MLVVWEQVNYKKKKIKPVSSNGQNHARRREDFAPKLASPKAGFPLVKAVIDCSKGCLLSLHLLENKD